MPSSGLGSDPAHNVRDGSPVEDRGQHLDRFDRPLSKGGIDGAGRANRIAGEVLKLGPKRQAGENVGDNLGGRPAAPVAPEGSLPGGIAQLGLVHQVHVLDGGIHPFGGEDASSN
jgi:hypothetical protein